MTGIVPRFSRTPGHVRDVGPDLGEHTEEVVGEIAPRSNEGKGRLR